SAEFIRNVGFWQSEALRHPVLITHHGRERLVLSTPEHVSISHDTVMDELATELAHLRETQAGLFEPIDDVYLEFDGDLNVVLANRAAKNILGRSQTALHDTPSFERLPKRSTSILLEAAKRVLLSKQPHSLKIDEPEEPTFALKAIPLAHGV